jgi:hypothetical protein
VTSDNSYGKMPESQDARKNEGGRALFPASFIFPEHLQPKPQAWAEGANGK